MHTWVSAIGFWLVLGPAILGAEAGRAVPAPSALAVRVGPCFVPDSGVANLFGDRLSRVDFLFYYVGAKPIKGLDKCVFTVDLPKAMKLRSVALMSGWKKPAGKFSSFPQETVQHEGLEYTRYVVPLPGYPAMAKAEPAEPAGTFGGICYNHCKLFLEPLGKLPDRFTVFWRVAGKPAQAEGSFPVRLFATPCGSPKPKRISLIAISARLTPEYNDPAEIASFAQLLRAIGISHVPVENGASLREKGLPDVWTQIGFKPFAGLLDLNRYSPQDRSALPDIKDYLVGLDGQRAKGTPAGKHHGRLFCPISASLPGRTGFELMKSDALRCAAGGAAWIDFDLEVPIWTQCFCDDCLQEFAAFSHLPAEQVFKLKPADLVLTYPEKWYRFRCRQTARFYANLRRAVQAEYPSTKISANNVLNHLEYRLADGLEWGACDFAEDPRLLDGSVDLHTVDALTGGLADPIATDAQRRETGKPLIATAGCSYCVAYNHAGIVGRRVLAEKKGRPLGYDRRGDLQRLGIVHSAASGASGVRVAVLEYEETIDAEVALSTASAAAVLAKVEDYYLDWQRADEDIEVVDLTEGPSPYQQDRSLIAGGPWKFFYNFYGGVQYRVHRAEAERVVSLFNWDLCQDKQWLLRLKDAPIEGLCVYDLLGDKSYVLEENIQPKGKIGWSKPQLEKGLRIRVPAAGFAILYLGKPTAAKTTRVELIPCALRRAYLQQAARRPPANQYAWRTGKQYDLKDAALRNMQRTAEFLPPGTIPQRHPK